MSTDWDEIQRLAADFQQAQLTSTLQRLSEQNCIEIVSLLVEKKLVEVIFTSDGKEYITPEHLIKEILDELSYNGGRVNLVEVSKSLQVDLHKIEKSAAKIANENRQIYLILGQLVHQDYINYIAEEIDEKLLQNGKISIDDLTVQLDLPSEFIQKTIVDKNLGKLIKAKQDPSNSKLYYTEGYIERCKAKLYGALNALTKPTNLTIILQYTNIPVNIFYNLFDELSPKGVLTSKTTNAQYIPNIYTKLQAQWINNFYRQNNFLEYDAVAKLGITNPKQYIHKNFASEDLIYLKGCAVSSKLIELTVVPALLATKQFIELSNLLPTNMSACDQQELFDIILMQKKKTLNLNNLLLLNDGCGSSIIFTEQFLEELIQSSYDLAAVKAKAIVDSGVYQQHLITTKQLTAKSLQNNKHTNNNDATSDDHHRDERRRKATSGKSAGGGSGSGGTQGRETKTKSLINKKNQRNANRKSNNQRFNSDDDNDDPDTTEQKNSASNIKRHLELICLEDIMKLLQKVNKDLDYDFDLEIMEQISNLYHKKLNQFALYKAEEYYESVIKQSNASNMQTHTNVQEKVNDLLVDLRLYEKGLKLFPNNIQSDLLKYLLKSLGNDICNELLVYIAGECHIELKTKTFNVDQRNKIAQECGGEFKMPLLELNKSLNKSLEEFVNATENVLKVCSMITKKIDKKRDRLLINQHKKKLLEQLQQCTEQPALTLHLTALILFTTITGCLLHASGKFVQHILNFLKPKMTEVQNILLSTFHDLVIEVLRLTPSSPEHSILMDRLQDMENYIKQIAVEFDKSAIPKNDSNLIIAVNL